MNNKIQISNIGDKFIYISWTLLFMGVISLPLPILYTSDIAVRMNVAFATLVVFIKFIKKSVSKIQLKLIILAYTLLTIQVIGLLGRITVYSITTLLLLILLVIYIIFCVDINYEKVNHKVFKLLYYTILFASYVDVIFNNGVFFDKYTIGDNTIGGMLVFLTIINIALRDFYKKNRKRKWLKIDVLSLIALVQLLMFTRSRTSLGALILILLIYFIFSKVNINKKCAHFLFWGFIVTILCMTIIYSFITTFSFYSEWNQLSVKYFGKNIDSSRPMLWKRSIQAIGGNWLFGIGTGTLPSDFMMFDASFHNQFLQLFMQNGALGLLTFYYLLYTLWKPMANNLRDPVIKICAAGFFGIIIYNSFETTLLQNKIALGLIEWQLIAIGVSRGERINGISRDKNIYRKGGKKCTRY